MLFKDATDFYSSSFYSKYTIGYDNIYSFKIGSSPTSKTLEFGNTFKARDPKNEIDSHNIVFFLDLSV